MTLKELQRLRLSKQNEWVEEERFIIAVFYYETQDQSEGAVHVFHIIKALAVRGIKIASSDYARIIEAAYSRTVEENLSDKNAKGVLS